MRFLFLQRIYIAPSTLHPQNEYKFFLNNTAVAMTIAVMAG
jgi:hypothetical protein